MASGTNKKVQLDLTASLTFSWSGIAITIAIMMAIFQKRTAAMTMALISNYMMLLQNLFSWKTKMICSYALLYILYVLTFEI